MIVGMSDKEIAEKILAYAHQYRELESPTFLWDLYKKYYLTSDDSTASFLSGGGLHDLLVAADATTLKEWALAAERYVREKSGRPIFGGLTESIGAKSKSDLIEIILDYATKEEVLNDRNTLDYLVSAYELHQ